MNAEFCFQNPHKAGRDSVDAILESGESQIAIACAFCTAAGGVILGQHGKRLALQDSFLVVSAKEPTDFDALEFLYKLAPGNIYVHFGAESPEEFHVGRPLMHSKVFYARNRDHCRLWVGSHNLTASAMVGLNLEAAVHIEGHVDEHPFVDALKHLHFCRDEAIPFEPGMRRPPPPPEPEEVLVLCVESEVTPITKPPEFVHLCLPATTTDRLLSVGGEVVLYVFKPGKLNPTCPDLRAAEAAFHGSQTAVNFTERHPPPTGIPAAWREANYIVEKPHDIYRMEKSDRPPSVAMVTQSVFKLTKRDDSLRNVVWFSGWPRFVMDSVCKEDQIVYVQPDLIHSFSHSGRTDGGVRYRPVIGVKNICEINEPDFTRVGLSQLRSVLTDRIEWDFEIKSKRRKLKQSADAQLFSAKYRL